MNESNFFIKEGYICNDVVITYEVSAIGEYWTEERIFKSHFFQHHVYTLAAEIAKENNFSIGMDLGCGPATKAKKILAPVLKEVYLVDQPNCESLVTKIFPEAKFFPVNLEYDGLSIDKQMDLIVCADVLEHLADPTACLEFALNHLSPSGIVVFSTPERDILRGSNCNNSPNSTHVREWNGSEFKNLLQWKGFTLIDYKLVPQAKLNFMEDILLPSMRLLPIKTKRWHSCQVAICKRS